MRNPADMPAARRGHGARIAVGAALPVVILLAVLPCADAFGAGAAHGGDAAEVPSDHCAAAPARPLVPAPLPPHVPTPPAAAAIAALAHAPVIAPVLRPRSDPLRAHYLWLCRFLK